MKFNNKALIAAILIGLCQTATSAPWTYRGTLNDGGVAANGRYDLRVSLVDAKGIALVQPITLNNVVVEKGSFVTSVDFGVDLSRFEGAKIITDVQQGNSGFVRLGEPKAIASLSAKGGPGQCWGVDGNTTVSALQVVGVTDSSASTFLRIQNGGSSLFLTDTGGVEQDFSAAAGDGAAAWNRSSAAGAGSFTVGRGQTSAAGINSFAYSDAPIVPGPGVPGFSAAPGEFLVRSGGGVAFNTVPGTSDFAIGPRPGLAESNTLLTFDSNGRSANFGLLANGQTGINAPIDLYLQGTGGIGINSFAADFLTTTDLVLRPKSTGDEDVDFRMITRDGLKSLNMFVRQSDGTLFLNTNPIAGANRLQMGGATLSNGGTWTNASSRSLKEGFASVNPLEVLNKLTAMSITTWNYKGSEEGTHMGPVAEDFKAAFGLAGDGKSIGTVDADGVALAAIQGLNQKLESENAALRSRLEAIEAKLAD